MRELSMHILDIAENSINAGADLIQIQVEEIRKNNRLTICIVDNGRGMAKELLEKAVDPFMTTRSTRRVGLGLSMLKEAASRCNGTFLINSREGKGAWVEAAFQYDHIDRAPLGDMSATLTTLVFGNPGIDFQYRHRIDDKEFYFDTRELKGPGISLQDPETVSRLMQLICKGIEELGQDKDTLIADGDTHGQANH